MNRPIVAIVVLLAGCAASGPPAPPLAAPIMYMEPDYEENGAILPVVGFLTITIQPEGEAKSICRRQILTDVERSGDLTNSERWELYTKAESWAEKAGTEGVPSGKPHCSLTYGTHRTSWEKGASLSPELEDLVRYLKAVSHSLSIVRKRG